MDISNVIVWHVAAGDNNGRNYVDLCLERDVILIGPGNEGQWPASKDRFLDNGWDAKKLQDISRFADEMSENDIVVLRLGTSDVYGVGKIAENSKYAWSDEFGDIDGWDLQHFRRVKWLWDYRAENNKKPKSFEIYTFKWGDTVWKMTDQPVLDWISSIDITPEMNQKPLADLGSKSDNCDLEKITEYLFNKGVSSRAINDLTDQIGELTQIANWYNKVNGGPSEHETVAYLVIPLLRVLGWTPQKMAVEWNRVDVALFNGAERKDENLAVVVEAKSMHSSCLNARSQAEEYAEEPDRASCNRLIVTNGLRYGIFLRKHGEKFPDHPTAYLNLTRMRDSYPTLGCRGAKEAFYYMTCDWRPDPTDHNDREELEIK